MQIQLTIDSLIEENMIQLSNFDNSEIMKLIKSSRIKNKEVRDEFLDHLQIFSDSFQKIVMQRFISTNCPIFSKIAEKHLQEEFGHNFILRKNRHNRETPKDEVIQENADWFIKKMLVEDDVTKHILMHLVLETTADIFFKTAYKSFLPYENIDYLKLHDEEDEEHAQMGMKQLACVDLNSIEGLFSVFHEGWDRVNRICNRIAEKSN